MRMPVAEPGLEWPVKHSKCGWKLPGCRAIFQLNKLLECQAKDL